MMPNIPHIELTCASLRRPTGRRCTLTEFPSLPAIATQRKHCESVLATVPPCLTSCADPYYRPVRRTATPHPLAPPGETGFFRTMHSTHSDMLDNPRRFITRSMLR